MMNDSRMPGPASLAPCPVATKMPVPTTDPMPRAARSKAVRFFLSWVCSAASAIWAGVFVFQMLMRYLSYGAKEADYIASGVESNPLAPRLEEGGGKFGT